MAPLKSVPTFECTASENVLNPTAKTTLSNNPGSYEDLHRKCRDVFPVCFEGAKVMVQKGLSSHFQVLHTLSISRLDTGYRFGATYVGNKEDSSTGEIYPVLLGDTDAVGNTSATFLHKFGEKWRLKLQSQIQGSKLNAAQGTIEYRTRLATVGVTLANTDLINESGIIVTHLLRRFTSRWDVGAEFVYQYGKHIPGSQVSVLSYGARYNGDNCTVSTSVGGTGVHLGYFHKQVGNLSFGIEFEANFRTREALTTFAYEAQIPDERVTMRASVDTNWNVGGVFEKRLSPHLPLTLAISGLINHAKADSRFGVGLIIG